MQDPTTRPRVAQAYAVKCADGRLIGLHLSTPDKVWKGLLRAIDSPAIAGDSRFCSYERRVESYEDLAKALGDVFVTRPSPYWMERLHEQEVPFASVYGTDEVVADPQVRHLGSIYEIAQAGAEPSKAIRRPVRYDGERGPDADPAPRLGQHNQRVLAEAGFGAAEVAELTGDGRQSPAGPRPRAKHHAAERNTEASISPTSAVSCDGTSRLGRDAHSQGSRRKLAACSR